jgi:hypothetical protein
MNPPYQDEEITLRELLEKIKEYWTELWRKKWWIILLTLPFMAYMGYKAVHTDTTYTAQLTYTLNDGSGGAGALAGLLGTFGLGKGGKVNLDKIVALSKSRNIIHQVLFTAIPLDTMGGKTDFVANHLIGLYRLDALWSGESKDWTGFRFSGVDISQFSPDELYALKKLYGMIVGMEKDNNALFGNGFSEETGILTMTATTVDEELSIKLVRLAFNYLKQYYISNTTSGSESTFSFVENKTDSIFSLLTQKEFQLSKFNDSHRNLTDPNLLTERRLLETEIFKLKTMYGEATKNRELADFSLSTGVPDISIIDEPLPPLDPRAPSLLIELIKGCLLGGLIASAFFLARKIVFDALSTPTYRPTS